MSFAGFQLGTETVDYAKNTNLDNRGAGRDLVVARYEHGRDDASY